MASIWGELKRRNVVRVAIAYAVACALIIQLADSIISLLSLPDWFGPAVFAILLLGFPLAVFVAWAYELTPEGIKKEEDVDRSESITATTGRKIDFIIIGVLTLAVAVFAIERFVLLPDRMYADSENPSIAVLPFVNMSSDPEQEDFADGMSAGLMNVLTKIPDLKVAGRTSSFAFKGKHPDIREVGEILGVNHVLDGSVHRSGDELRVTAQLIKVDDGFQLWSETYDRKLADIFDVQDELATEIARQLRVRLNTTRERPTDNVDAYTIYLESLARLNLRESGPLEVIAHLDRALVLDPEFAEAHELKAVAYWMSYPYDLDAALAEPLIFESASAALEIDRTLLVARVYQQFANPDTWSWKADFDALETALQEQPDNFNLQRALCYALNNTGYNREALQCSQRMVELEPLSHVGHQYSATQLRIMGRRQEAREQLAIVAELDPIIGYWDIAFNYLIDGEDDAAIDALGKGAPWFSWNPTDARKIIDGVRSTESGKDYLDNWASDALANASDHIEANSIYYWYLAFGYTDDYWDFFESYEPKDRQRWTNGVDLVELAFGYPDTGVFRHPAFMRHAERTGLIDLWEERGAPDFCKKVSGVWTCN